jgi:hypothetical protein
MSPDLIARRSRTLAKDYADACVAHRAAADKLTAAQRRHAIAPGSLEVRQTAALQLAQQALDAQTRYADALSLVAKSALLVLAESVGALQAQADATAS